MWKKLISLPKRLWSGYYGNGLRINVISLIFAPTPGMQNRIGKTVPEFPLAVMPTGLDDSFYIEDEEDKNDPQTISWEEKNGHYSVPYQRLEEEKNPIFLWMNQRLKEKLPFSFRVLLLGERSMRKELEVLAEQMGLSDTMSLSGKYIPMRM